MSVAKETFNWGILGAGKIARKLVKSSWSVSGCKVLAIASTDAARARAFSEEWEVPRAYGCYHDLVADSDIDIVYVANTHNNHKDAVCLALGAGKHVLCEKPMAVNASEVEAMIAAARSNGRFLMEGMWTRFLPAIKHVRTWLKENRIGKIRQVQASFGMDLRHVQRLTDPNLAGGALLDLGIYPISFASMIVGGKAPESIDFTVEKLETGVDGSANMLFRYPGGIWADLKCSCEYRLPNEAWIIGESGEIYLPADFYAAQTAILRIGDEETVASYPSERQQAFKYQMTEVQNCLSSGQLESSDMCLEETLLIARTMEKLRREWGVYYPFE